MFRLHWRTNPLKVLGSQEFGPSRTLTSEGREFLPDEGDARGFLEPGGFLSCDIHTHTPAQKKLCKLHTVPICSSNLFYKLSRNARRVERVRVKVLRTDAYLLFMCFVQCRKPHTRLIGAGSGRVDNSSYERQNRWSRKKTDSLSSPQVGGFLVRILFCMPFSCQAHPENFAHPRLAHFGVFVRI